MTEVRILHHLCKDPCTLLFIARIEDSKPEAVLLPEASCMARTSILVQEGETASSRRGDAELEAATTPLEDHIAHDSPLQRMSRDTRRIDQMEQTSKTLRGVLPPPNALAAGILPSFPSKLPTYLSAADTRPCFVCLAVSTLVLHLCEGFRVKIGLRESRVKEAGLLWQVQEEHQLLTGPKEIFRAS